MPRPPSALFSTTLAANRCVAVFHLPYFFLWFRVDQIRADIASIFFFLPSFPLTRVQGNNFEGANYEHLRPGLLLASGWERHVPRKFILNIQRLDPPYIGTISSSFLTVQS